MKYIRYKKCGIVLFPNIIKHKTIGDSFHGWIGDKIVSAGFVDIRRNWRLECYGVSASLGVSSLEEDTKILSKQF